MAAHTKGALNLLLDYESNDSEEDCVPGPKISVKRSLSPDGREEQLHKKLSIEKKYVHVDQFNVCIEIGYYKKKHPSVVMHLNEI